MSTRRSIRTRLRETVLLPLAVLALGVLFAVLAMNRTQGFVDSEIQSELDHDSATVEFLAQGRVNTYADLLLTLRSFYSGSERVDRAEFQTFVGGTLDQERYPGVQSLQYLRTVTNGDLSQFELRVRADRTLNRFGYPQFSVDESSGSVESYIIEFIEPIEQNKNLMGLDLGSSPEFRTHVERARDTGGLVASAPFVLLPGEGFRHDPDDLPDVERFYLMLAVYEGSEVPTSLAERRESFRGVVAGLFVPDTMLASALPQLPVALELWDSATRDVGGSTGLIYRGTTSEIVEAEVVSTLDFRGSSAGQTQLRVGDRWWDLRVVAVPDVVGGSASELPVAVLIVGVVAALLLATLILAVENSRYHAKRLAVEMTKSSQASEARAQGLERAAGDAIISVTTNGTVASCNAAAVDMLGWSIDEIVGQPIGMLLATDHSDVHKRFCAVLDEESNPSDWSVALDADALRSDGTRFAVHLTVGIMGEAGDYTAIWVLRDVSAQVELQDRLSYQARHDALTGLPNRGTIQDRISGALVRARSSDSGVALLFLDLDRFKNVNDSLGHEMGDRLLVEVVGRLQSILRDSDVLGRVGGDEFVLVAEDLESDQSAMLLAQRLVDLLSEPFTLDGKEIRIGASVGVAVAPHGDSSPGRMLRESDLAMYKAKERGRNLVQMFDLSMQENREKRIEIEQALRTAVQRNELELYYQPLIHAKSEMVTGFEALLRWRRPGIGLVSPDEFIPVAEESDLIIEIGDWVLNEACRQIAIWERAGQYTRVGVNISGRQLAQPDIVSRISGALVRHRANPKLLVLEVTESYLLEDAEAAAGLLAQMKQLGLRVAIDDFGTGYSSLTYLRRFPVDILKVDRDFVSRLGESAEDESIIAMIINLAHTLGLTVVAEGVEKADQLTVLRKLGVTLVQGYYFSKALPLPELEKWLAGYAMLQNAAIDDAQNAAKQIGQTSEPSPHPVKQR